MKAIVILSTEPWGKMMLSKMHFAIEMAAMGDRVYFVNPPQKKKGYRLASVNHESEQKNIVFIDTKALSVNLFLKYKLLFLYRLISKLYIGAIKKLVADKIDEVWCFDPNTYTNLHDFDAGKSFLLLYDLYSGKPVVKSILSADLFITVSKHLLEPYRRLKTPKLLLQHGLGRHFSVLAKERLQINHFAAKGNGKIKIGYVGNLLRGGIDIDVALKLITAHPDKEFHFWGPFSVQNNNVVRTDTLVHDTIQSFIGELKKKENVFLHGVKLQNELSSEMQQMDAFLFLYKSQNDLNSASNAHKIMEYLSTGKVIVSTFVSNYESTDLLEMCSDEKPDGLAELFQSVISNLDIYNSQEKQKQRIRFALDNTYLRQIERIRNIQ